MVKKIPLRKCVVTQERLPKKDLLRIVKNNEGEVFADLSSKANGRGAYIKKDVEVLKPLKVFHNTRIALSQVSVWILAVAIIPPLCNAMIAPIMKKFSPKSNNSVEKNSIGQKPQISKPLLQSNNVLKKQEVATSFRGYLTNYSTGMRV